MEEFRHWLVDDGKSDNTIQSYLINVGQYMKWYSETFGEDMTLLIHGNILDYRSYLQNIKRNKATTINAKLSALISYSDFLLSIGRQSERAITKADLLRIQAAYVNPNDLNEKDVDAFRQKILFESGERDHAIATIMAYAGTRISETVSLALIDVDCVGREISVRQGKGNKDRVIYIGDKVINAVKEYLKVRRSDSLWMFPGRYEGHLHRSVVNKVFNRYSPNITPHKLRHFYCSNAYEKEYSIVEIAQQAGHSNIHTTMRYTNPTRQAMKDKANKL